MLTEEGQNLLAPIIIDLSESPYRRLEIKCKVSVMEGRFHVDTSNYNFIEHGFSELHFELEFKGIFSGSTADNRLLVFYSNILSNRLSDILEDKKLLSLFKDQITFRNLCFFAGFKIRDFLKFMHDICDENPNKEKITQKMVYDTCVKYYRQQVPNVLKKVSTEIIASYLAQLGKMLKNSKNQFYFITDDFNENFFQVMLYFRILSFVSYSRRGSNQMIDARGFLIDLSTAFQFNIVTRSNLKSKAFKYLNFSDADTFVYNIVDKKTERLVIKLLKRKKLSDAEIMDDTEISTGNFEKIKQKILFDLKYSSEDLVDEDKKLDEDEELKDTIEELASLRYISFNLATILTNKGITKEIFLKWAPDDHSQFKSQVPSNYRSTLSRAYNHHHK
ncbi:hypothetical protein CEE45_07675 [Candidatus Heimdallarchaeota archaeon B3_Heim]|nr:MAG: hypothetical protein CEE45_07675 [Candidatus Heimdallarchaeota archaeon B3_Heim]